MTRHERPFRTHQDRLDELNRLQARWLTEFEQGLVHACSMSDEERRAAIARLHNQRFDDNGRAR